MHALSSYGSMKPKAGMFREKSAHKSFEFTYNKWKDSLEGSHALPWNRLKLRFAEDFQFAILRAGTVTGIKCEYWSYSIFTRIYEEESPFEGIGKLYMEGKLQANWRFFAEKLALKVYVHTYYPCVCPEWLFSYGYSQKQYLSDLAVYWENIADGYYRPWETTRFGEDSPELVRLKKLGQQARSEIDEVARRSEKYIKR